MVDGETAATDLEKTECNRKVIESFVEAILIQNKPKNMTDFIHPEFYKKHSPNYMNDIFDIQVALSTTSTGESSLVNYIQCNCILAEGNFVFQYQKAH
jgi:hypothetical protein